MVQPDMSRHHWYPQKINCVPCLGARIEFKEITDFRHGACGVHRKMDLVPCVLGL